MLNFIVCKAKFFKLAIIIALSTCVLYGVSKADIRLLSTDQPSDSNKSLTGIYGIVTSIVDNSLTLDDSNGSKYPGVDVFNVYLTDVKDVSTNDDQPIKINISDIKIGDKIIARGYIDNNNLNAFDIISFSYVEPVIDLSATTTATTTEDVATSTATTTPNIQPEISSTSIDEIVTDIVASSSESNISLENSTSTDIISDISTSTDTIATTTTPSDVTVIDNSASSSDPVNDSAPVN